MASPLSRKQRRQAKNSMANVEQKEIKLKEIASNSNKVKSLLNKAENLKPCAETSTELELERQLENERALTKTQDIELRKMEQALRFKQRGKERPLSLRLTALNNIEKRKLRAETNTIKADLKATQDLLQISSQKHLSNEGEMQLFRDFCETKINQQMDINIKLKAALDKSEQDLKASQDLLKTQSHHQQKKHQENEGEISRTCQAKLEEQIYINEKTTAALKKTEQDLKDGHQQWDKERSFPHPNMKKPVGSFWRYCIM